MADSFADLWNSSAPAKQTGPRTLADLSSASTSSLNTRRPPNNDVFSMLAATGSSSSVNSQSVTPSYTGRTQTPPVNPATLKPIQRSSSTSADAFSGLLSPSFTTTSKNGTNLTIAQRAAQVERQRSEQLQQSDTAPRTQQHHATAWAGLDALSGGNSSAGKSQPPANEDDWTSTFSVAPKTSNPDTRKPEAAAKPAVLDDDWGFGDFGAISPAPTLQKPEASLLDLDPFSPSTSEFKKTSPERPTQRSSTPGDFDFGDREDALLNDHSDLDDADAAADDILGDLGKPVEQVRPPRRSPSPLPSLEQDRALPNSPPSQPKGGPPRSVSPPPHIVGQIVEMGFSPQQARIALAATDTGLDVQAALETLLANGAGSSTPPIERDVPQRPDRRQPQHRDSESDHDVSSRTRPGPRRVDRTPHGTPLPAADTQRNLQEQADKLLAQASEIGLSVFSRANAFWKEGKEKVQKAYEERAAARNTPPQGSSTRPRWMQGDTEHEEDEGFHHGGGFKDDHDHDEVLPPRPSPESKRVAETRSKPTGQPRESRQPPAADRSKVGNLLSDDAPAAYVSPFRRKAPSRSQTQPPTPQAVPSKSTQAAPRAPSPLLQRDAVPASPSAIATSAKHKEAGTEMFKLGRYAEAETSYSTAITALPDTHLLLVPLYNNRALARIKTGDHSGAVEDCTTVISLIGPSYHPAREAKVVREDQGSSVDLADGLIKALRRRAEAYEGKEKWDAAKQDWETIAGAEWAGKLRSEAVRGVGRCRRMVSTNPDGPSGSTQSTSATVAPSRPKPKPRPVQRGSTPPSEALHRVREANAAAEAEDQAKHELKDVIDAKLQAWKGGKETNIRALIASLETVLWPELGWQKVGMHELIAPNQVKIRYTKAIAKLHPDKLNVNNTTLEQRMIANGVFGSLSDAWSAFKQ